MSIESGIRSEVAGLIQRLIERITELGRRYDSTSRDIETEIALLSSKVTAHLAEMGVS